MLRFSEGLQLGSGEDGRKGKTIILLQLSLSLSQKKRNNIPGCGENVFKIKFWQKQFKFIDNGTYKDHKIISPAMHMSKRAFLKNKLTHPLSYSFHAHSSTVQFFFYPVIASITVGLS